MLSIQKMPRSSSSLFIPAAESLVLSLVGYFFMVAVMDQLMPSDFSPAMRSVLLSQLVLIVLTITAHMVISAVDKSLHVLDTGNGPKTQSDGGSEDEISRQKLMLIISKRISYRYSMNVANAYSAAMGTILLLFVAMFIQSSTGSGLESSVIEQRARIVQSSPDNYTTYYYASSKRLDWVHATVGSSGWQRQVTCGKCMRVYVCVCV
jgi:hypothetical protein